MKAVLVIDDIQEEWFENNLSAKYELLYYPNGEMKELGIYGKRHLKPMPQKKEVCSLENATDIEDWFDNGYNTCLEEITGENE